MYTHKFNTQQERDNYILSNDYETPFLSTHENGNKTIVSYNKDAQNVIRNYYTQQPLTFKITSPGDIVWQGQGITIEYKKNNEEWSSITSESVDFYSTQITVSGKSGTYTYGGFDSEGMYMNYWENGDDKLYADNKRLEPGYYVYDSGWNEYVVLTSQNDIVPTSTQITVSGKSGTYTYGGYDSEGMYMYYWENGNDKLYADNKRLEPGNYVSDSEWNSYVVLTSQNEKIGTFVSVVSGDVVQFRGNNATYNGSYFGSTCNFNVEGNIMSLIDSTGYTTATTLSSAYTFNSLFQRCTGLTSAENLILPATTLATYCYYYMFNGCTSLMTAPELPATTLATYCYYYMFNGCTSLMTAPELPATTLANSCYYYMFSGCTSLMTAPELPATTLADSCYNGMFEGCTSLTTAPELPATTLADWCYNSMFVMCTSLTSAPVLPATTLAKSCYWNMFAGCSSLTSAPELPATTLAESCYNQMFIGCTSLITAPELPATTLTNYCYHYMFNGCTSLMTAPALPATTLAKSCYSEMFAGCTSLTKAPELPATTLAESCYYEMFRNCINLNYIKCLATNISASYCTSNWVGGVASSGTFVKNASMTSWTTGNNGIPSNWIVQNIGFGLSTNKIYLYESENTGQITVTSTTNSWVATTEDNWISLSQNSGSVGEATVNVTVSSTQTPREGSVIFSDGNESIILKVVQNDAFYNPLTFEVISGGTIYWKKQGSPTERTLQYKLNGGTLTNLTPNNSITVTSGDVVQFFGTADTYGSSSSSAYHTFSGSTAKFNIEGNIMSLIDSTGYTSTTTLSSVYTFVYLFRNCTGLTSAENLIFPATTLAESCYNGMFIMCTSLTTAPELPATALAKSCYYGMFQGCTSLTTAPELPATTLAESCYYDMFQGCTSLTTAPELPATTLTTYCYYSMFIGCTSLTTAPELPATTLTNYCYTYMFYGCTLLTTAPELPATTLAERCYNQMFRGCTSLTTAPELPATTLADWCYYYMFQGCTNLNYIKCLATNISASNCTSNWVGRVASSGTFVKNASMTGWTTGVNGIPSGWVVVGE